MATVVAGGFPLSAAALLDRKSFLEEKPKK
jgi:hypothetical protein